MVKKSFLLSLVLLTSCICANQGISPDQAKTVEDNEKNIFLMEQLYQAIIQEYDQEKIATLETAINKAIHNYIDQSIADKTQVTNTKSILLATKDLLEYFNSVSSSDEAFAAASMLFMISWSKLISEKALTTQDPQKIENIQAATDEIKNLIEIIFLDPMTKRLDALENSDQA